MQKVGSTLLDRLRNIYDPLDPAPVRKPLDCIEFYSHSYIPPAGAGFDPSAALQRFAAIDFVFDSQVYLRKVVSRGSISKVKGQQSNSVTVSFSNVDADRLLATWAQTTQIEGMWLVIRYVERDINDSAVLFVGRAGKPSTISNKSFSISATTEVGKLNQEVPPASFLADDPEGRDPTDPLYEGIRFVATTGSFTFPSVVPSTSFFGRLFGRRQTVYSTVQYSSVDGTPYGDPIPEILGRCQMKLIPFLWLDRGTVIVYYMAVSRGPIKAITNLKTITQGFSDPEESFATPPAPAQIHLGDAGGTGTNATPGSEFPTAGLLSHLAYISAVSTGSRPDVVDGPPEVTALILGRVVPLPDNTGVYSLTDWTDNPVHLARWFFTFLMGVNSGLMEDSANVLSAAVCDYPLIDRSNGEQIFIASPDNTVVTRFRSTGVIDSRLARIHLLGESPSDTLLDPVTDPTVPTGFDPTAIPNSFTVQTLLRKRYTFNAPITSRIKALDYLFKTLYPAFRGYHVVNASGRFEIRVEQAADNGLLRSPISAGATAIPVDDVTAWKRDFRNYIRIGSDGSTTSEIRIPSSATYTSDANAITLSASATGVTATASGATLAGGSTSAQASATITLSGTAGAGGTVTTVINGITISYILDAFDTLASAAQLLVQFIKANTQLARFIDASASGAVVTIKAKWGVLNVPALAYPHAGTIAAPVSAPTLSAVTGTMKAGAYLVGYSYVNAVGETTLSPLATVTLTDNQAVHVAALGSLPSGVTVINIYLSEAPGSPVLLFATTSDGAAGFTMNGLPSKDNAAVPPFNSTAEEVLRTALPFSSNSQGAGVLAQSGLTRANIKTDSYNFPLGSDQTSINQIKGQYRDSKNDFALTPFKINDREHQLLVGSENPLDLDLSGVDNWHQAFRLGNGALAKYRDGDWFNSLVTSTGEALLLEEDDLITASDDSGGHVNVATSIESLTISPTWEVSIQKARRYSSQMFRDDVRQHIIPLPSTLHYTTAAPPVATSLVLTETGHYKADGTWSADLRGIFNFGGFVGGQLARIFIKRPGDADYLELIKPSRPDGNNLGSFEIQNLAPGTYHIRVLTESFYGATAAGGYPDVTKVINGKPVASLADVPVNGFSVDPNPSIRHYFWTPSPDEARGWYQVYGTLTGYTWDGTYPDYANGGTPSNLLYEGIGNEFYIPLSDPNFNLTLAWIHRIDGMGNFSRWLPSRYLTYAGGLQTAPTVTVDTTTSTSDTVTVHIVPDTSVTDYTVTATQVQIRQSGGSWPSDGAAGDFVFPGIAKKVSLPWSASGTVNVRARYLGSPNSDWGV